MLLVVRPGAPSSVPGLPGFLRCTTVIPPRFLLLVLTTAKKGSAVLLREAVHQRSELGVFVGMVLKECGKALVRHVACSCLQALWQAIPG